MIQVKIAFIHPNVWGSKAVFCLFSTVVNIQGDDQPAVCLMKESPQGKREISVTSDLLH